MSAMREIEDYVLDSPIALPSAYEKLVKKYLAALLARQHFQPQLVEVHQAQIMSEGESPSLLQTQQGSGNPCVTVG